jgi:hypothetical protein
MTLPTEVWLSNILPHIIESPIKIYEWVNINRLLYIYENGDEKIIKLLIKLEARIDWTILSYNPNAVDILLSEENYEKIDWEMFSLNTNPKAIEYLKQNPSLIDWEYMSLNDSDEAINLLINQTVINIDMIRWDLIASNKNPKVIQLIKDNPMYFKGDHLAANTHDEALILLKEKYMHKINWADLSQNTNPIAIQILRENIENIYWDLLSSNPSGIDLLREHEHMIDWTGLSRNSSPIAIQMLKNNYEKIIWWNFSCNESDDAIELLKENFDRIDWYSLSGNPNPHAIELLKSNLGSNIDKIHWENIKANFIIYEIDHVEWRKKIEDFYIKLNL